MVLDITLEDGWKTCVPRSFRHVRLDDSSAEKVPETAIDLHYYYRICV